MENGGVSPVDNISGGSVKYGELGRLEREVVQAEPLYGVAASEDK
jgi:hypothetical protein